MAIFRQLCSIVVNHTYFADGLCRKLAFFPTPATARFIHKTGLLLHGEEMGMQVFIEGEKEDCLRQYLADPDEFSLLVFKVFPRDTSFWYYTTPEIPWEQGILYFDNRRAIPMEDGSLRLHRQPSVSTEEMERLDAPVVTDLLSAGERLNRPGLLIVLDPARILQDDDSAQIPATTGVHRIHFKTRETLWRYYLLGPDRQRPLSIIDKNNTCHFRQVGRESLPDGRTALTFLSTELLPLTQRSDCIFQLKEHGDGGEKVLIRRLPAASPNQQRHEVIDGQTMAVSDIFINC